MQSTISSISPVVGWWHSSKASITLSNFTTHHIFVAHVSRSFVTWPVFSFLCVFLDECNLTIITLYPIQEVPKYAIAFISFLFEVSRVIMIIATTWFICFIWKSFFELLWGHTIYTKNHFTMGILLNRVATENMRSSVTWGTKIIRFDIYAALSTRNKAVILCRSQFDLQVFQRFFHVILDNSHLRIKKVLYHVSHTFLQNFPLASKSLVLLLPIEPPLPPYPQLLPVCPVTFVSSILVCALSCPSLVCIQQLSCLWSAVFLVSWQAHHGAWYSCSFSLWFLVLAPSPSQWSFWGCITVMLGALLHVFRFLLKTFFKFATALWSMVACSAFFLLLLNLLP